MTNEPVQPRNATLPMTNESALLGLHAEFYKRIAALQAENQQLRAEVARLIAAPDDTARRRRR